MLNLGELSVKLTADHTALDRDIESTSKGMKSKLGGAAALAGKAMAAGIAAAGTAVVALGKKSIEAYAKYEQLTGGVDTLFKDASKDVQSYASKAYKTAGLSANQYMEQATSFSASLLQSLGGDTKKAAKVADMAIKDMADNANKMGTDTESIQNAYQGFAKQNYTMLDNLKLGYGGTKSEMERLLKDAQALSGQKYDISNLNDVYQAIHVVQTELGITGTTAKEAETTIEGSIKMAKSAWENLLVGFSNQSANVPKLVRNMVNSVRKVAKNLLPRVKIFITTLGKVLASNLQKNGPKMVDAAFKLLAKMIDGFSKALPGILKKLPGYVVDIAAAILKNLPKIVSAGAKLIGSLLQGMIQAFPALVSAIKEKVKGLFGVETLKQWAREKLGWGPQHRVGLGEVPYDGYVAVLHKGERIQTAAEANHNTTNNSSRNISINFNGSYSFRNKSDIDYFMKESAKLINRRVYV